jgi:hypothetical protein
MEKTKTIEVWKCVGRNGSGCGWTYEAPIPTEAVSHVCKDGNRRAARLDTKRTVENKDEGRRFF